MNQRIIILSPREDDGVGLYAKRLKIIFSNYEVLILSKSHFNRWLKGKSCFKRLIINCSHFFLKGARHLMSKILFPKSKYGNTLTISMPLIDDYLDNFIYKKDNLLVLSLFGFITEKQLTNICIKKNINPIYYPLDMEFLSACFNFKYKKTGYKIDGISYPSYMFFFRKFIKHIHNQKLINRKKMGIRVVSPSNYVQTLIKNSPCFKEIKVSSIIYLAIPEPPLRFEKDINESKNNIKLTYAALNLKDCRKGYELLSKMVKILNKEYFMNEERTIFNLHLIGNAKGFNLKRSKSIAFHFYDFLNSSDLYKVLFDSIYLSLSKDDFGPTLLSFAAVSAKYILATDTGVAQELKEQGYPIFIVKNENDIKKFLLKNFQNNLFLNNSIEFKNSVFSEKVVKNQWSKFLH